MGALDYHTVFIIDEGQSKVWLIPQTYFLLFTLNLGLAKVFHLDFLKPEARLKTVSQTPSISSDYSHDLI